MAAITISRDIATSPAIASAEDIRAAFTEHRHELAWLAEFLTGDELTASACVTDASIVTENNNEDEICRECLQAWIREATVRSALYLKRMRIDELSPVYEDSIVSGRQQPLSLEMLEFVVRESDAIRVRVDSLCRFALILCGVERRSVAKAALMLGISKHAVEAAYSTALESLEILYCQVVIDAGCASG